MIVVITLIMIYVREKRDVVINYIDGWDMVGDGSVRLASNFE